MGPGPWAVARGSDPQRPRAQGQAPAPCKDTWFLFSVCISEVGRVRVSAHPNREIVSVFIRVHVGGQVGRRSVNE